MAQPGNDNQKSGVVAAGPDNTFDGVYAGGDNFTPLSMATEEDGDEADRGQSADAGKWGKWLFSDKPGID